MNIRENARAIRLAQEDLDQRIPSGFLHIITLDNRQHAIQGGAVSEVTTAVAAKHLTDGTARIATEAEVEALRKKHEAIREVIQRQQQAFSPKPLSVTVNQR